MLENLNKVVLSHAHGKLTISIFVCIDVLDILVFSYIFRTANL